MSHPEKRPFVLLESPFAGDVETNRAYAMAAMRHSLLNGEAPFASHLLYTQMLDDDIPFEREIGIEAGLSIGSHAVKTVVYVDRGISGGMQRGIDRANAEGRPVEMRSLVGDYAG